ncbi:glycosyltransferase family 2 protein [Candidatus Saccharibacteria bacterium]|nr:MAG: glycosyltransferase family 2 protein [Candidatus Saccharibacteria bacterium]
MPKQLTVSIIVPVYNDAIALERCLAAIAEQTVMPHEVIVVDNNSTDRTVAVAESYPFVKVLQEAKQGVVHARNRGFDAATGDIIGRLDADSCVASDWVATLQALFATGTLDAVSGSIRYHDIWLSPSLNVADILIRKSLSVLMADEVSLQGANMALGRSAWHAVRSSTCVAHGLHEDFDLAIHLRQLSYRNRFEPSLRCSTALRQATGTWLDFARYMMVCPATYFRHGRLKGAYITRCFTCHTFLPNVARLI